MIDCEQLQAVLVGAGIPERAISILDDAYVLPTAEWVTRDLSRALNGFYFQSGIRYTPEQFDCNHFSKTASVIADWSWAKTEKREAALAFGVFGYITDGHMITVAVHREPITRALAVAFYEPQPSVPNGTQAFSLVCMTPKQLTAEDIQSCIACWFF